MKKPAMFKRMFKGKKKQDDDSKKPAMSDLQDDDLKLFETSESGWILNAADAPDSELESLYSATPSSCNPILELHGGKEPEYSASWENFIRMRSGKILGGLKQQTSPVSSLEMEACEKRRKTNRGVNLLSLFESSLFLRKITLKFRYNLSFQALDDDSDLIPLLSTSSCELDF